MPLVVCFIILTDAVEIVRATLLQPERLLSDTTLAHWQQREFARSFYAQRPGTIATSGTTTNNKS